MSARAPDCVVRRIDVVVECWEGEAGGEVSPLVSSPFVIALSASVSAFGKLEWDVLLMLRGVWSGIMAEA